MARIRRERAALPVNGQVVRIGEYVEWYEGGVRRRPSSWGYVSPTDPDDEDEDDTTVDTDEIVLTRLHATRCGLS